MTMRRIKCAMRPPRQLDGDDQCVVVGDSGRLFATSTGFSPTDVGVSSRGVHTPYTRYAMAAVQNVTTNFLTLGRMVWDDTNSEDLKAVMVGGTNGVIMHLIPAEQGGAIHYAFDVKVQAIASSAGRLYTAACARLPPPASASPASAVIPIGCRKLVIDRFQVNGKVSTTSSTSTSKIRGPRLQICRIYMYLSSAVNFTTSTT